MGLYQLHDLTGKSYKRSNRILLDNPLDGIPHVTFLEEEVITIETDNSVVKRQSGILTGDMKDPTVKFNLLHPETDEVIGSSTYQDIYVLMYSLYRHLVGIRDAPPPTP